VFWATLACIGYAILLGLNPKKHAGGCYFAVFLTVASVCPMISTTISLTANTWQQHYRKAIAMGMVFSAGNSGGIVSSQAYRNKDSPGFKVGHGTALAFAAMNGITAAIMYIALNRENKRRDQVYGPAPADDEVHDFESEEYRRKWGLEGMTRDQIIDLGDKHPAYRYIS